MLCFDLLLSFYMLYVYVQQEVTIKPISVSLDHLAGAFLKE